MAALVEQQVGKSCNGSLQSKGGGDTGVVSMLFCVCVWHVAALVEQQVGKSCNGSLQSIGGGDTGGV